MSGSGSLSAAAAACSGELVDAGADLTSEQLGDISLGVAITFLGAFFYALGLCIQRAALTVAASAAEDQPAAERPAGCRRQLCADRSRIFWFGGLMVYGVGGLGLGTLALSYVTLAVTTSIFSAALVFNAGIARLWLKEPLSKVDSVSYLLIIVGIAVAAVYSPKATTILGIREVYELWFDLGGGVFWLISGAAMAGLHVAVYALERKYATDYRQCSDRVYRAAVVLYPVTLGGLEGLGYVGLKAAVSAAALLPAFAQF